MIDNYNNLIIIDGGYNIGEWSKHILENKNQNIKILGFEPNSKILENNLINDNRMIIINKGLSDSIGEIFVNEKLLISEKSASFTLKSCKKSNYKINLINLDNILKEHNFDNLIVKLDIEGYEFKALNGLINNLDKTLIIQFEYHNFHKNINKSLLEYVKFFKKYNFDVYIIGEYELLNISDNWYDGFDICNEETFEPVNKRPNYNGGNPNYEDIHKSTFKKKFRPENINLIAINKNKNIKFLY